MRDDFTNFDAFSAHGSHWHVPHDVREGLRTILGVKYDHRGPFVTGECHPIASYKARHARDLRHKAPTSASAAFRLSPALPGPKLQPLLNGSLWG